MRILVTGSRDWDNEGIITAALYLAVQGWDGPPLLVSGACPTGADRIAEEVARECGWLIERHPANWAGRGNRAGYIRNAEMVNLGADVCLAFIKNESPGATMTANLAEKVGIPVKRYTA